MGFGRACAPVRCAHPSFWAHCHAKQGTARPPLPIAALLLLIRPTKIYKIYRTWAAPPRPSQLRLSFRQYFVVNIKYRCDRFFSFLDSSWIFSFCYPLLFSSLLFISFLFIFSYPSLLLSSYSSRWYYSSYSYILNCLLYYRHNISVILSSFFEGAKPSSLHISLLILLFLYLLFIVLQRGIVNTPWAEVHK